MEPPVDTLGRWMAHYIAELIDAAENAPPDELAVSQKKCFHAILELWGHRAELPNGKRPFEDLEPIIRALESLNPDDETPRYFRSVRSGIVATDEDPQTLSLLENVSDIDSTARILIGQALSQVAHSATNKSKVWVALAKEAGIDLGVADIVIQFVSSSSVGKTNIDLSKYESEHLQKRIKQLEDFAEMAAQVSANLKERLKTLPSTPE